MNARFVYGYAFIFNSDIYYATALFHSEFRTKEIQKEREKVLVNADTFIQKIHLNLAVMEKKSSAENVKLWRLKHLDAIHRIVNPYLTPPRMTSSVLCG